MAEELTADEVQLLIKHLEKFPGADICPVCASKSWQVVGIEAAQGYFPRRPGQEVSVGFRYQKDVLPVVTLMCNTCGYVRSFAWNFVRVVSGAEHGNG